MMTCSMPTRKTRQTTRRRKILTTPRSSRGSSEMKSLTNTVETKLPAAIVRNGRSGEPTISNKGKVTRVKHVEMFADVLGSVPFSLHTFVLNPGNSKLFPWLSAMAQSWEHYRFERVSIEFQPIVGTSANGLIALAPDYNLVEPVPTSMPDLMVTPGAARSQTFIPMKMHVDAKRMNLVTPWKYITHEGEYQDQPALYDSALIQLAVEGADTHDGVLVGNLFISYEVAFMTPQVDRAITPVGGVFSASKPASSGLLPADGTPQSFHWSDIIINTLGLVSDDNKSVKIPAGTYRINATVPIRSRATPLDVAGNVDYIFRLLGNGEPIGETETHESVNVDAINRQFSMIIDNLFFFDKETTISTDVSGLIESGPQWADSLWSIPALAYLSIARMSDSTKSPLPN